MVPATNDVKVDKAPSKMLAADVYAATLKEEEGNPRKGTRDSSLASRLLLNTPQRYGKLSLSTPIRTKPTVTS